VADNAKKTGGFVMQPVRERTHSDVAAHEFVMEVMAEQKQTSDTPQGVVGDPANHLQ
jgi:hypothetical protein